MEKHGKVLYEKNAYEKMYPASLTKILTAIVTVEHCNLNDIAVVSQEALDDIQEGYIVSQLTAGEEVTIEQLLHLLLICSYNDTANILAEHIAGSTEAFSELMNETAQKIGCKNTHFLNGNGTHNENHYTTAYDMALIAKYAMQYDSLREIVSKTSFRLDATNKYAGTDRIYGTTNKLLTPGYPDTYYKYAKGIKTGFTTPAGECLASYAEKDDMVLYVVTLNNETSLGRYTDTKNLFEYGFDEFEYRQIAKKGENIQTIDVKDATTKTKKLNAVLENNINVLVNKENEYTIEPQVQLNGELKAPIQKGTVIGTVKYEIDGMTYQSNLLASSDVEKTYMPVAFIVLFLVLIVLFGTIKIFDNLKKKKRMKKIKSI